MTMIYTFILIHSPLVGSYTWHAVGIELKQRGHRVFVPDLYDTEAAEEPYWKQEVDSVLQQIPTTGLSEPIILVAHSGAGVLLPAICHAMTQPVFKCIYVDAMLPPQQPCSRLDMLRTEDSEWADALEADLGNGVKFPNWTEEQLIEVIPMQQDHLRILEQMKPRGLDFFTEVMPAFESYAATPSAYLKLSTTYQMYLKQAIRSGWQTHQIEGGHFHMLNAPSEVADIIISFLPA